MHSNSCRPGESTILGSNGGVSVGARLSGKGNDELLVVGQEIHNEVP